jgi:integrase
MKRRNAVRLTLRTVEKAVAKPTSYFVWDLDQPGFGLRIEPSGAKSFYIHYRLGGRGFPSRKLKLGDVRGMSVAEARKEAAEKLVLARKGEDPMAERIATRNCLFVHELIDLYGSEGLVRLKGRREGEDMTEKTAAYTMARLRNHVVPVLGHLRLVELDKTHVESLFKKVGSGATAAKPEDRAGRGAVARGGRGAARKVVRDFSAVCTFAIDRDLMKTNPVASARVNKVDNERKDYLTTAHVQRLGRALVEAERDHGVPRVATDQIRLWLLTGLRRNEGAALKWSEVRLEHERLELESSKSETKRPLTPPAVAFLQKLKETAVSGYVFPARRGDGWYTGTKRYLPLIMRLAGLDRLFPHLLRHTFGSNAISQGLSIPLAGALLGHASLRSTLIYAHVQHDAAARAAGPCMTEIAAALAAPARTAWGDDVGSAEHGVRS